MNADQNILEENKSNKINSEKSKELNSFIKKHEDLPAQGTPDWIKGKVYTIGGSEMAIMKEVCCYGNVKNLISRKLGFEKFWSVIWMLLGKVFEEIPRVYLNSYLDTTIYETGSIPGLTDENGQVIQSYSPDGLGVVSLNNIKKLFPIEQVEMLNNKDLTVLFEFKCPGVRIPKKEWCKKTLGYKVQLKTGLATIDITDIGIYVDSVIRRCSIHDLGYNKVYCPISYQKNIDLGYPITYGIIGIYKPESTTISYENESNSEKACQFHKDVKMYLNNFKNNMSEMDPFDLINYVANLNKGLQFLKSMNSIELKADLIDLGNCPGYILEDVLDEATKDGVNNLYYSDFTTNQSPDVQIEIMKFKQFCNQNNYKPIGVLPWKLFDIVYRPVYKDPEFLNDVKDKIAETIMTIKKLNEMPDDIKKTEFDKLFPTRKLATKKKQTHTGTSDLLADFNENL